MGNEHTVKLLLRHGANALVMNDDFQTPLDIARAKGYGSIVRAIEGNVCLFSGWLREIYGPGFVELLAPHLLSRRVWAVVLPCGSRKLRKPFRLELAMYSDVQDAQPRTIVPLWKANLEEPNFNQPDLEVIISDISRIPRRWKRRRAIRSSQESRSTHIKFVPVQGSETLQLQRFSNACKGIPQAVQPSFPSDFPVPTAPANAPSAPNDDSHPSALHERSPTHMDASTSLAYSTNNCCRKETFISGAFNTHTPNGSVVESQISSPSNNPPQPFQIPSAIRTPRENPCQVFAPSAPPAKGNGTVQYPSIDTSVVDISSPPVEAIPDCAQDKKDDSAASSCTICLDAPIEGACIPCGHMVGCMMCLTEIHDKKWGCPVCRAPIDRVVRIYSG
ncbi:putative E3 ubiquitin-protein ligase XBAT35 isoform X2 [Andrographis paniculata]|nr:putative E3 ubiquitin-protein ligase XBAT35 isoform X2 [Andrographis paniculata]